MNISSMVSMGFMMRNVTSSICKEPADKADKSSFGQRLETFRQDNAFGKLKPAEKAKVKEKEDYDWSKVSYSEKLFDEWDSTLTAEQALAKLDANLSRIGEYTLDGTLDPREVLEHIAAQHSIYKRHVTQVGDNEQRTQLNKIVEEYTTKYAQGISEQVGGFYEANGMAGERERIYNSVLASVDSLTSAYDRFAHDNAKQFGDISSDSELTNKSLANELRRVVRAKGLVCEGNRNAIELSKASMLARYSAAMHKRTAKVTDEEELGFTLGKDIVRALDYLDTLHGTRDNKWSAQEQAFMSSLQVYADKHLDKVDKLMAEDAKRYAEHNPQTKLNPFNTIDREAVFSVARHMANKYLESYSITTALEAGRSYGSQQYLEKADVASQSQRYTGSTYWESVIKGMLSPANAGTRQYILMQNMLTSKSNSWLNSIA